MMDQDASPT
jgi:spermidine dehydrogenase